MMKPSLQDATPARSPHSVLNPLKAVASPAFSEASRETRTPGLHMPVEGEWLGGRYEIVKCVGMGGSCGVYKALDHQRLGSEEWDPLVALKVPRPRFREDQAWLSSFEAEAVRVMQLTHPNIVKVFGINRQDDGLVFIVMEYLQGGSLGERVRSRDFQGLPWVEVEPIVRAVGNALSYVHTLGIVHRDVKPSNVFITHQGDIKLIDFGIARHMSDSQSAFDSSHRQVTPAYASPAVLQGLPPDRRDDVYSLACTTYELLTGQHPYRHQTASDAQAAGACVPRAGMPLTTWKAFERALAFDTASRTLSVDAFVRDLRKACDGITGLLQPTFAILALLAGAWLVGRWLYVPVPDEYDTDVAVGYQEQWSDHATSPDPDASDALLSNRTEAVSVGPEAASPFQRDPVGIDVARLLEQTQPLALSPLANQFSWSIPDFEPPLVRGPLTNDTAWASNLFEPHNLPDHAAIEAHYLSLTERAESEGLWSLAINYLESAATYTTNDASLWSKRTYLLQQRVRTKPESASTAKQRASLRTREIAGAPQTETSAVSSNSNDPRRNQRQVTSRLVTAKPARIPATPALSRDSTLHHHDKKSPSVESRVPEVPNANDIATSGVVKGVGERVPPPPEQPASDALTSDPVPVTEPPRVRLRRSSTF